MIQQFSMIMFVMFMSTCFIIGIFDIVSRRYQYALLLVNGLNRLQCIQLIFKERSSYCLVSIILSMISVLSLFFSNIIYYLYNDRTSYFYLNPNKFCYSNYSLFDFSCINEIKQRRKSIKDK